MKSFVRWVVVAFVGLGLLSLIGYLLVVYGVIRMNYPSKIIYPIQGIDVSHHQGDIDFSKVAEDGWDFVLMKATEGGDWKDTKYSNYLNEARESGLVTGAYHYYSFCTDPLEQANHYISVVGSLNGSLPPAIDLEFDNNCNKAISIEDFREDFDVFLDRLLKEYKVYPIVYCNESFYFKYLNTSAYSSCFFWVRNVVSQPELKGRMWTFWQYTAEGSVKGIKGPVDLNAFSGRRFEFDELILN